MQIDLRPQIRLMSKSQVKRTEPSHVSGCFSEKYLGGKTRKRRNRLATFGRVRTNVPGFCCFISQNLQISGRLSYLGPSGLHLGSPKPHKACPDLTRLSPEAPRGSQSPNHTNRQKSHRIQV